MTQQIFTILTINPGSTSTKIAIFDNETERFTISISHSPEELAPYKTIADQFSFRKTVIMDALGEKGFDMKTLDIIVGRGGLLHPMKSGIYRVNDLMRQDLINSPVGEHASNLGGLIAYDLAKSLDHVKAYIADPVVVDEMDDIARMTGFSMLERKSIFHALNQKAVAREYAQKIGRKYEDLNLIVAHMGGGISIGAHLEGRVVDVNNALDGEGPFTPERAGTVPVGDLIEMCFSGEYTHSQIKKMVKGEGGMVALYGTNDARAVREKAAGADGDPRAKAVINALAYNVAKYIGAMATVLCGKVDAIILTGGMAHGEVIMNKIIEHVSFISAVEVVPGEDEMSALALNGLLVMKGEIEVSEYLGAKA
ncbi:MAG: butyrate kinase [Rikenellaceae bacterium]